MALVVLYMSRLMLDRIFVQSISLSVKVASVPVDERGEARLDVVDEQLSEGVDSTE